MDVVIGSVHAVTEDGHVVIASASGSQLASYAFGADRVVWVVGAQKVVPDLDTAFDRIEKHSLPLESERLQEVYGMPSAIGKELVVRAAAELAGWVMGVLSREAAESGRRPGHHYRREPPAGAFLRLRSAGAADTRRSRGERRARCGLDNRLARGDGSGLCRSAAATARDRARRLDRLSNFVNVLDLECTPGWRLFL
jgi:LUD domain